ncbi:carbohydrate-binding protein AQN-1-like [Hippopotamus amphibius kiboko]|uniref:carbohydrate-binding protein AQN-1-like n=1 Tax=Hippopotamus amphibius kiboko TaxID=575201 RepID=UPI00259AAA90|nr:carbohydrate-binding protein AQN-1-like [Hippopotamus amphibius kiboko]
MKLSSAIPWVLLLSSATLVSTASDEGPGECGGVLTNIFGIISSYIGLKPNCTWTIQMKPDYKIVLAIPSITFDCNEEHVEIIDGPPGTTNHGKICAGIHLMYRSSSNVMTVKYIRKSNYPASPFDLYYYGDQQPQPCLDAAGEDSGPDTLELKADAWAGM